MSGPIGSVNPRNNAFAGGTLTRAAPPTSASGSFSSVGAPGFPNPGIPAIASARNNRGSNVTVPYARVVPLHARDPLVVADDRMTMTGQKRAHEYDGLESGELAWVMGKQYAGASTVYAPQLQYAGLATMPLTLPVMPGGGALQPELDLAERMGPSAGYGPDRMQRLAYTNWVEAYFAARVGPQLINLKTAAINDQMITGMSSSLKYWTDKKMASLDMFAMPDIAYALQTPDYDIGNANTMQVSSPMVQGLFIMERGPFLRSIGTDHRPVTIEAVHAPAGVAAATIVPKCKVNRHLGSDLAQSALEALLKKHGVFNWTPDGICMSKYETGPDGIADAQFDAKMSQLFNVAVQGSAITKTWTGDSRMTCLPSDRVFILVVGDVSYSIVDTDATTDEARTTTTDMHAAYHDRAAGAVPNVATAAGYIGGYAARTFTDPAETGTQVGNAAAFTAWQGGTGPAWTAAELANPPSTAPGGGKRDGIEGYNQAAKDPNVLSDPTALSKYKARAEYLWRQFKATTGGSSTPLHGPMLGPFDQEAARLRNGSSSVGRATLTNLRLMRATSSFLVANSHYENQEKNPNARLGLPITYNGGDRNGTASYVLGGWCIGKVMDSAASRTMMGSVVRVSASSMALNINVNVEWWNADKLYQHYQDRERYTKSSSDMKDAAQTAAGRQMQSNNDIDANVPFDQARRPAPSGTLSQRDIRREAPSKRFSLDLDAEAYNETNLRPVAAERPFSRVWR